MGMTASILSPIGGMIYQGQKAAKMQKRAGEQAARDAEAARRQQDRDFNRLNQKSPNIAATMRRNRAAGSTGVSGTYLTGAGGAPANASMLGRTTILGS